MHDRFFTDRVRRAMQYANRVAQRFGHALIGTEDILIGLLDERIGVFAHVLENLEVDLDVIRGEVEKYAQPLPDGCNPPVPRAESVVEYAIEEAKSLNHHYIGTEHILLGLLREQDGLASHVLGNLGVTLEGARQQVVALLGIPSNREEGGNLI